MNRLKYDSCSYSTELRQSTSPLNFVLDPIKYENCQKCRMELGIVGGTAVSHITGNLVDLENDLRNQTRPATKCSSFMYSPSQGPIIPGGAEYIKPVTYPNIDTTPRHLPPCQMQSFVAVPNAPQLNLYSCPSQSQQRR